MYLSKYTNTKGDHKYTYVRVIESVRVGRNIQKKVIHNLGRIDNPNSLAYTFQSFLSKPKLDKLSKIYTLPMAISYICMNSLELENILNKRNSKIKIDVFLYTLLMIIGRIVDPDSELSLTHKYKTYALPIDSPESISVEYLYRTLDYLSENKEEIENEVFESLKISMLIDVTIVFYDLTSSYFEGVECNIARFGYSRDHREDRVQIEIGLVIDNNGIPIYHEVFEGNTADSKTYKNIVKRMNSKFNIKKLIFVSDKDMFSSDNIEYIKSLGFEYIISKSPRNGFNNIKKYLINKSNYIKIDDNLFYLKTDNGLICFNPFTAKKNKLSRDRGIVKYNIKMCIDIK